MIRRILQIGLQCCTAWLGGILVAGCNTPTESSLGTIEVTSSTSGQPVDADGYAIVVDQGEQQLIAANATLTISDVPAGEHQVGIEGIASHCSLAGADARPVSVSGAGVGRVTFQIECSTPTGGIEVTTTTSGESPDPDGYSIVLDGQAAQSIATSDLLTLPGVSAGTHTVRLTGLASNCAVAGENPRTVAVGTDTARTTFEISCPTPTGAVMVRTTTVGIFLDPDGYTVSLDGGPAQPIGPDATMTLTGVPVGDHTLRLTGVALNCALAGDNSQTGTVVNGATLEVLFQVSCRGTGASTLLVASDRSGTSHLYRVQDDGSGLLDLTPSLAAFDGDWSPDGSRIVLNTASGIQVRNVDGSNPVGLGVRGSVPRWSPDGSRIVFESDGAIRVMKANGSQVATLALGFRPDWSPNGSKILFDRIDRSRCLVFFCEVDLFVMSADGSDVRRLTAGGQCGVWSPDGSKIAYIAFLQGVFIVNADGTGARRLAGPGAGCPVIWSPDGAALAYPVGQQDGSSELTVIPSTGGTGTVLASSRGSEFPESWK